MLDATDRETVIAALQSESHPVADLAESGVALSADTLGGLEALAFECRNEKVPIHSAEVGPVGRPSVVRVADVKDPTHRAVLAFHVPVLADGVEEAESAGVKVFRGEVMYRILEEYLAWRTERTAALETQRRLETVHPAKIKVPFQGHFANQDDWCTPAAVDALETAMQGAKPEIYRYDAAHAFFNERSAAYDLACATQAWGRMAAFLTAKL